MSKSVKILLILSIITAFILIALMDTYSVKSGIIIDDILFIGSILLVGGWILSFVLGIFTKILPESKPVKARKKKMKKKEVPEELTPLQFILFYPLATFTMLILYGFISSGFKP